MSTKVYIKGDSVIFNFGDREFVRELSALMKSCNVSSSEELMDLINESINSGDDQEQMRRKFGAGIDDAILLAVTSFYGQKDLDGNPAVIHAIEVGRAGQTVDEKIVGYIHDVVEDTDITFDDLSRMGFTDSVLNAAKLCTHDHSLTYDDYLNGIINSGNPTAIQVKKNDLHHNLDRGEKTLQIAIQNNDQKLIDRIQAINLKHRKALDLIQKH